MTYEMSNNNFKVIIDADSLKEAEYIAIRDYRNNWFGSCIKCLDNNDFSLIANKDYYMHERDSVDEVLDEQLELCKKAYEFPVNCGDNVYYIINNPNITISDDARTVYHVWSIDYKNNHVGILEVDKEPYDDDYYDNYWWVPVEKIVKV